MRFYNGQHRYYCGVDLHTKRMYLCILDQEGHTRLHRNVRAKPHDFLNAIDGFRDDLVVGAECMFTWYWLADVCAAEGIPFVLGHALAMKAIHGGKAKNDKLDSFKIATLLRGGLLPQAYVYPAAMRATRDLLRRRLHLVRKRGQLLAHIQNTRAQYQLPEFGRRLAYPANRAGVGECFPDPIVRKSIDVDLALLERYDGLITDLELTMMGRPLSSPPRGVDRGRPSPEPGDNGRAAATSLVMRRPVRGIRMSFEAARATHPRTSHREV
jgi:transposase